MAAPVAVVFLAKIASTALIVGSGAVGGIFTPSLFIGAALGSLVASAAYWFPALSYPDATLLALVGMGAFMAAVSHAPLMAILMVFEMTMDATLLLPLMAGCVLAYTVSRLFRSNSLYAVLNRRHIKLTEARRLETITMAELMEPVSANLTPGDTLADARALFEQSRTRYLYVLDTQGHFLGVVSVHRLTEHLYRHPRDEAAPVLGLLEEPLHLLPANCTLLQAWDVFVRSPLERIPIVDNLDNKILLGVVTKREMLGRAKLLRG
jgi:CIC family chloride channel protein